MTRHNLIRETMQMMNMKPWELIIREEGRETLDAILVVYVNFYYAELEIIDLCGRWIPHRNDLKEKFMLVEHAADEMRHAQLFKKGVEDLGLDWNDLDHSKYRLTDVNSRFAELAKSDNEIDVLIGLNLYGEGVLAMEELTQLYRCKPQFFNCFGKIIPDEVKHLKFGLAVTKRILKEYDKMREYAQRLCDFYAGHVKQYLWQEISSKIDRGIQFGYLDKDYRKQVMRRFENVMSSAGLKVTWPSS